MVVSIATWCPVQLVGSGQKGQIGVGGSIPRGRAGMLLRLLLLHYALLLLVTIGSKRGHVLKRWLLAPSGRITWWKMQCTGRGCRRRLLLLLLLLHYGSRVLAVRRCFPGWNTSMEECMAL